MAIDAAQLLAELTKNVDAHKTRAMAGNEAMSFGPLAEQARGSTWDRIRPRLTSQYGDNIAAAGQMDALNRDAAAEHLGNVNQAPGMGQAARLQGIDPSQPGVAEAYGTMVASGMPENEALAQLTANPNINPQAAANNEMANKVQALQLEKLEADIALGESTNQNRLFTQEGQLRDDSAAALKPVADFMTSRQQVLNLMGTGDAAGAQAALVKMAKVLDPTSVAREGEVEVIRKGAGTMAALQNSLNMAQGEGFTPAAIGQFTRMVEALTGPEMEKGKRMIEGITAQAERYGINPGYALSSSGIDVQALMGGPPTEAGPEARVIDLTQGNQGMIQR